MSAIEAQPDAGAANRSVWRSPTLWTGLLALGWAGFLYDTEPDWFNFIPVVAIWAALTAVGFALTGRWRFAALAVSLLFLAINAVARVKFAMVAMAFHVFDVLFHASLTQAAFFFNTFPKIAWTGAALLALAVSALIYVWRREAPTALGWRARSLAAGAVCLAAAPTMMIFGAYGADFFHDHRHGLSAFFASFRDLPALWRNAALVETGPLPADLPTAPPALACRPGARPPHVILMLYESALPPGVYPQLPFPEETKPLFASIDGSQRRLRVETFGGATWLTDFASLTGLSTRDFGSLRNFAVPFMAGRLEHALPQYLRACGYDTTAIYPVPGDFGATARFYSSIGFDRVIDQTVHKAPTDQERDGFYYGVALNRLAEAKGSGRPQFISLSSMATHAPWDFRLAPEALKPGERTVWSGDREYDEYMWRLVLGARDRVAFKKALAERFPGESFLIVTYGDHQPALKKIPLRDAPDIAGDNRWFELPPTARAFETYYQIDAVNYAPRMPPKDIEILDVPNLSTILVDAARLPRDAYFNRRADLIERCGGLYYTCEDRKAVLDFQTWLVANGWLRMQ